MTQNLYSLGLLRNGKVYNNRNLAVQGLTQAMTDDGVAKLARYLYTDSGGTTLIKTIVGVYANADQMTDNGGGQSSYTILDFEGTAEDIDAIKQAIQDINEIIGEGFSGTTLTDAIIDINERIGSGFTSAYTVADAIELLREELIEQLTVTLEIASAATSGYETTYILKQGSFEIGKIDIPKESFVESGSLVRGYWSGDTFTEDPDGTDTAIKFVILNQEDPIYINTKDLVIFYNGGDGINVDNDRDVISVVIDPDSEGYLTLSSRGLKLDGIQSALDKITLEGGDGITVVAGKINAHAASYSANGVRNPISVDEEGIKFDSLVDCGLWDDSVVIAETASDIDNIPTPSDASVYVSDAALLRKLDDTLYKNIEVANTELDEMITLKASDSITINGLEVSGVRGSKRGTINYASPIVRVNDITVDSGATIQKLLVDDAMSDYLVKEFTVMNATVEAPLMTSDVLNVYEPADNAVITVKNGKFDLSLHRTSAVMRLSNGSNATGVTVNFENIDWKYENSPSDPLAKYGTLIVYQPQHEDVTISGDLTKLSTWTFNFKNCRYNGIKIRENFFGQINQALFLFNIGGIAQITNPQGIVTMNFE